MTINKEDLELIRKMEEIGKRGYYVDSNQLTSLYNRVLDKHVNPTNCSACCRQRLNELVEAANRFERLSQKLSEAPKQEELTTTKEEENGGLSEAESQLTTVNKALTKDEMMKIRMAKVRAHRKQNNSNG